MKKCIFSLLAIFAVMQVQAQGVFVQNALSNTKSGLQIGGYGEVNYSQNFGNDIRSNGTLDVQRMILFTAYNFNDKVQWVSEIEFEHVQEVYVEQAFLNYKFNEGIQLRAGLLLIPMGIVNELHESPTFNGVARPSIDNSIVPTTWREIGAGFTGRFPRSGIRYQLYAVNGFASYNSGALLRGSDMLRKGRQKGAESFMSQVNLSARVEYFAIPGLKLGLSAYFGDTQSSLYNGLAKDDTEALARADSSVVGIRMLGLDARYNIKQIRLRAQYIYSQIANAEAYNTFTQKDLGSAMSGFYAEAAYEIALSNTNEQLIPFVRYENYNTHLKVPNGTTQNDTYARREITAGIGWRTSQGSMFKLDYRRQTTDAASDATHSIQAGVAIMF